MDRMEVKLEDLHHTIDIKEYPILEYQQDSNEKGGTSEEVSYKFGQDLIKGSMRKSLNSSICKGIYRCLSPMNTDESIILNLNTPNHSNDYFQIKTEEMEINLEDLHHSIDIKEEAMTESQLDRDPLLLHTDKKSFECNFCDYKGSHKGSFNRHLLTHTGEKPFECNICDYKSSHKGSVKRHLLTHTGEKPFKCNICDYKCRVKGSLRLHLRIHTGVKPFECKICDYKSFQTEHLKNHLRTHTGEKPFECNSCQYKCSLKQNLVKHLRTHTAEKQF